MIIILSEEFVSSSDRSVSLEQAGGGEARTVIMIRRGRRVETPAGGVN